jgi:hypothetical protein
LVDAATYHAHMTANVAYFLNTMHALIANHCQPDFALEQGVAEQAAVADLCLAAMVAQRGNVVVLWSALCVLAMLCEADQKTALVIEAWGKVKKVEDDDDDDMEEATEEGSVSFDSVDGCKLIVKTMSKNRQHVPLQELSCRLICRMCRSLDGRMGLLRCDAIPVLEEIKATHNALPYLALANKTLLALETGQAI